MACRLLNVSRSGYYDWRDCPASPRELRNRELTKRIHEIHAESRESYGWPRVHAELTLGPGEPVNHKRVERLMREAGLQGIYRRKQCRMPTNEATADDLVHRRFTTPAPDRLWCTDITEHPIHEGKLYCAAVLDAYSRRIIGWSLGHRQTTELVTDALGMAILRRNPAPDSTILHSARNTRHGHSANGCARPACSVPWAPSAIVTTIR